MEHNIMNVLLFPVNDVEVSDGEKGCERAALIFKCTLENAPKVFKFGSSEYNCQ